MAELAGDGPAEGAAQLAADGTGTGWKGGAAGGESAWRSCSSALNEPAVLVDGNATDVPQTSQKRTVGLSSLPHFAQKRLAGAEV